MRAFVGDKFARAAQSPARKGPASNAAPAVAAAPTSLTATPAAVTAPSSAVAAPALIFTATAPPTPSASIKLTPKPTLALAAGGTVVSPAVSSPVSVFSNCSTVATATSNIPSEETAPECTSSKASTEALEGGLSEAAEYFSCSKASDVDADRPIDRRASRPADPECDNNASEPSQAQLSGGALPLARAPRISRTARKCGICGKVRTMKFKWFSLSLSPTISLDLPLSLTHAQTHNHIITHVHTRALVPPVRSRRSRRRVSSRGSATGPR